MSSALNYIPVSYTHLDVYKRQALGIHESMQAYTPNQDKVLECLGQNLEEGFYFMPNVAPGTEGNGNPMEAFAGKPWAQVYYRCV